LIHEGPRVRTEHIVIDSGDDPRLKAELAHSTRAKCILEFPHELSEEYAIIGETRAAAPITRYSIDRMTDEKNITVTIDTEKNGTKLFFVPGVFLTIIHLCRNNLPDDPKKVDEYCDILIDYLKAQFPGAAADRNDLLLDGKKFAGMTVVTNSKTGRIYVGLLLTWNAEMITAGPEEFEGKKYGAITGADQTGLTHAETEEILYGFIDFVKRIHFDRNGQTKLTMKLTNKLEKRPCPIK
jgi:hypothetical protein